jgi:CRISPR/Cas system endoribonuclease Cas6 (RAMP superfamily)
MAAPASASKWRMGFNSAFKELNTNFHEFHTAKQFWDFLFISFCFSQKHSREKGIAGKIFVISSSIHKLRSKSFYSDI